MYADFMRSVIQVCMRYGYIGVAVAAFLEGATVPFPGILLLLFAGALSAQGRLNAFLLITIGVLAYTLGTVIPYIIGRRLGDKLYQVDGLFGITQERLRMLQSLFLLYGQIMVILLRPISFGNIISYFAGMARMNVVKFLVLTFAGISVWATVVTLVGRQLGTTWSQIASYLWQWLPWIVLGGVTLVVLAVLLNRYLDRLLAKLSARSPK